MNSRQEWQEGPPKLNKVGPTTCGYCEASFPSTDALRAHKSKKIKDENNDPTGEVVHLYCEICDLDFHTLGGVGEHLRLVSQDMRALSWSVARDGNSNSVARFTVTSKTSDVLAVP
jgi:hypothetical protein